MRKMHSNKKHSNNDRLNIRADFKLKRIIDIFLMSIQGKYKKVTSIEEDFMTYTIKLQEKHYLKYLSFRYSIQNRFFSRVYDLIIETHIPDIVEDTVVFGIKYNGVTSIKNAVFVMKQGSEKYAGYLNNLNIRLITKRLVNLNFLDFEIIYNVQNKCWDIKATSIIGSTSWMLFPPIFKTVEPKKDECLRILELFELIASVLYMYKV